MTDQEATAAAWRRLIEALDPVARATRTLAFVVGSVTRHEAEGRVTQSRAAAVRRLAAARFSEVVSAAVAAASSRDASRGPRS